VDSEKGRILLAIARGAIAAALNQPVATSGQTDEWLHQRGACFVTLRQEGRLRGCIGSVEAHQDLIADVRQNAVAAALRDPRFTPLSAGELDNTVLEISLLSPPESMYFVDEADLLRQLRPGIDGLVLEFQGHRGTFLPAVWRQLSEPRAFLGQLKRKAGLATDFWSPEAKVCRYTTQTWCES